MQNKIIAITLLVFFVTSMFSSQSAFAGGVCFTTSDCSANDGNVCTGSVRCIAGICIQPPLTGDPCGSQVDTACSNPNICIVGFCDPQHVLPGVSCDNGDGEACTGSCSGGGTCRTSPGTGASCDDGNECTIADSCVVGACTGSPEFPGTSCDNGDGQECTGACNVIGSCITAPANFGVCDDGNECTSVSFCNDGVCDPGFGLTGDDCGAGGTECSAQDTCDSGTCVPNDLTAGTVCGDGGTECSLQDTCDDSGTCVPNDLTAGTVCGDGGTECSAQDTCDSGTCVPNDLTAGTVCGDSGTQCINQDTCNGVGACADNGFVASGTSCEDGEICSDPDSCDGIGACAPGLLVQDPVCTPDSDGDGIPDGFDECPSDPNKEFQGINGCGTPDEQTCGDKTMPVGNVCLPDLAQICGSGTTIQNMMCVVQSIGSVVGGTLLEINTVSLFVAAIGTSPVITGLVGITIAGVAGNTVWFIHRRKKKNE